METSVELRSTNEKNSFKKEILALTVLMFILVCVYFMLFRFRNDAFFQSVVVTTREARIIMIYHTLSIPFIAACTFWILEFYSVRKNMILTIRILLLSGTL